MEAILAETWEGIDFVADLGDDYQLDQYIRVIKDLDIIRNIRNFEGTLESAMIKREYATAGMQSMIYSEVWNNEGNKEILYNMIDTIGLGKMISGKISSIALTKEPISFIKNKESQKDINILEKQLDTTLTVLTGLKYLKKIQNYHS